MNALRNSFLLLLATLTLASCGGGGSGSSNAFTGPGNDTTITLTASPTTLPASPYTVGEEQTSPFPGNYLGSPYISEVTITWKHKDGTFVAGTTPVNVSVAPTTVLSFSTLDSTTTTTGTDQFHTLLGSGPVNVTAGVGTVYVHAGQVPGAGVVTVTATDPTSNLTISQQITINVVGAATGLPASISATAGSGVYIVNSGGPQSTQVQALVEDGSGALVNAPSGVSNVQFSIIGPTGTDATLSSIDGAGNTENGSTVKTASHNGIASVTFLANSQQGPVQVQATADRGDNNVDNGIQDPVSATTTVTVSDGKLDSLTLSFNGQLANSILVNSVANGVSLSEQNTGTTLTLPPDPDATYSFTVTAQGTDRQGNPVLPGTQILFGSIDSPTDSAGDFLISGSHGDPQEGGTNFTATDGQFQTAGGGAGPGDTLLVFGKLVDGNADLESASRVTSVLSQTHLTVATPFNLNDTTGVSVNDGPVLPYIIGRAQIGNITSPAYTNSNGRATTTLNYPTSDIGHVTALWAQGTGTDSVTGGTKIVTDIAVIGFPGLAPATIIISPSPIPGDITVPVVACYQDALGAPIQGAQFQFAFTNLGNGSGTLDGISGGGLVPDLTDASGCVTTTVTTTGIASSSSGSSSGTPQLTFSIGQVSKSADITAGGGLVLLAVPSTLGGNGGVVTLTLLNSNGTPVPGVQLTGSCTGDSSIGIVAGPGVTNASGQTKATIGADLNIPKSPGSGSCTFTTPTGSPTTTVNLKGTDPCLSNTSPTPQGCS